MTSGNDHNSAATPAVVPDKLLDHHRLQLSALLDGELAPDQARFLLRRLQHDEELAGCWSRWQLAGDVLRGQAGAVLPAEFAPRVAAAIAADAATAVPARAPRWTRWGSGAALAASVAVVALFVARQAPQASIPDAAPIEIAGTQVAATSTAPQSPSGRERPAPVPSTPAPVAPDRAGQLAAVAAVAEMPRRAAARRTRAQSQRAAIRTPARRGSTEAPVFAMAAAAPVHAAAATALAADTSSNNPFAPPPTTISARPWPRALLPNAGSAFSVGYGTLAPLSDGDRAATGHPFHPFQPRDLPLEAASPAAADSAPDAAGQAQAPSLPR